LAPEKKGANMPDPVPYSYNIDWFTYYLIEKYNSDQYFPDEEEEGNNNPIRFPHDEPECTLDAVAGWLETSTGYSFLPTFELTILFVLELRHSLDHFRERFTERGKIPAGVIEEFFVCRHPFGEKNCQHSLDFHPLLNKTWWESRRALRFSEIRQTRLREEDKKQDYASSRLYADMG
jgi:hypothetical protein